MNYVDPNTKKYEIVNFINMSKIETGYYIRFKNHDFGIFEPSLSISYFYLLNSNSKIIFENNSERNEILINLNLRYYFKRNKPKK
jgi:hypothetical protein